MTTILELLAVNALSALVLAVGVFFLARTIRQPLIRYCLWLLVLVKLVTPPIVPVELVWGTNEQPGTTYLVEYEAPAPVRAVGDADAGALPAAASPVFVAPVREPLPTVSRVTPPIESPAGITVPTLIAFFVWMAGALSVAAVIALRLARFHRRVRRADPAPDWLVARARQLAERFGLRRFPQLRTVRATLPPVVWAVGRPQILIPERLIERLRTREIDTLIAHELAHVARRDHWMRWFEISVLIAYWWAFPLVRWIRDQFQEAEEQCCDAWVLRCLPDRAQTYAQTLMATVDFLAETPWVSSPAASGFGTFKLLRRRFEMILENRFARRLSLPVCLGLLAVTAAALTFGPAVVQAETEACDKIIIIRGGERTEIEVSGDTQDVLNEIEAILEGRTKRAPAAGGIRRVPAAGGSGAFGFAERPAKSPRAANDELQERLRKLQVQLRQLEQRLGAMHDDEAKAGSGSRSGGVMRRRVERPSADQWREVKPGKVETRVETIIVGPDGKIIERRTEGSAGDGGPDPLILLERDGSGVIELRERGGGAGSRSSHFNKIRIVPDEDSADRLTFGYAIPSARGKVGNVEEDRVELETVGPDGKRRVIRLPQGSGQSDAAPQFRLRKQTQDKKEKRRKKEPKLDDLDRRIERAVERVLRRHGIGSGSGAAPRPTDADAIFGGGGVSAIDEDVIFLEVSPEIVEGAIELELEPRIIEGELRIDPRLELEEVEDEVEEALELELAPLPVPPVPPAPAKAPTPPAPPEPADAPAVETSTEPAADTPAVTPAPAKRAILLDIESSLEEPARPASGAGR